MYLWVLAACLGGDLTAADFNGVSLKREMFVGIGEVPTKEPLFFSYDEGRKFALQHKIDLIVAKRGSSEVDALYQKSLEDQCGFCVVDPSDSIYNRVAGDSVRLDYRAGNLYYPAQTKRITIGESPYEEIFYQSPKNQVKCRNCR